MWPLESEISAHLRFQEPRCHLAPSIYGTPANIRTNLLFLEARIIDLHLLMTVCVCLHSNVSGGLDKTIFFRMSAFWPFKVFLVPIESACVTSY